MTMTALYFQCVHYREVHCDKIQQFGGIDLVPARNCPEGTVMPRELIAYRERREEGQVAQQRISEAKFSFAKRSHV
jgi:hypothetical protein